MVSFSETLGPNDIPKALERLGFNGVDDQAVEYFLKDLKSRVNGGDGLDLAVLDLPGWYHKSVVEVSVQLSDLKWIFTLSKGPEMIFHYLQAQNRAIASLAGKISDLKTMIQAKDDYLKYCKDHGFDNLTVFKRKKGIDFKLESFEDRKVEGVTDMGEVVKEINSINSDGNGGKLNDGGGKHRHKRNYNQRDTSDKPDIKTEPTESGTEPTKPIKAEPNGSVTGPTDSLNTGPSPKKRKKPQGIIKKR
ncbi:hypothetical protein CLIB1444_03S01794 [[Candida] jaroonii]|uniref:Uncharacterized protein n=1 Tax=[Candida] jaroonii TaxID=467808 RepID=A0ACA9Y4U0_9ASCO|nr:hypothetical protein CLIB1444_03S01794 [[Candida] jaroonii]